MGDLRLFLCCSLLPVGAGTASLHELNANQAVIAPAPVTAAAAPAKGDGHITTVKRAADGLFYVTLRVNDRPVRFMVDTGASVVVLSRDDARLAGLSEKAGSGAVRMRTAGGGMDAARVRIPRIADAKTVYHDIDAVVADGDMPVSLLGQSLLSRLGSVSFQGDRLTIAHEPDDATALT